MEQQKKGKSSREEISKWEALSSQLESREDYLYPRLTLVVCTYNCAQSIGFTLENILSQKYVDLEIVVVDASSIDRTMKIVKGFHRSISRIYTVTDYNMYEMMNRGISLASGKYIHFFFPGDYYISQDSLGHMMRLALDNDCPDLVYCGCVLRGENKEPRVLLRPICLDILSKGKQLTSIQSCWFRVDTLRRIGKFDSRYALRGGFDLLCRLCLRKNIKMATSHCVLTDYDRMGFSSSLVFRYSKETFFIIYRHFGLFSAFKWWMFHNHFYFIKWCLKKIKDIFVGR